METISFIILIIAIAMLLHITLTNILYGISLRKNNSNYSKYSIINGIVDIIIMCVVITIAILLQDTNYYFITDIINIFIIGWILSNYYFRYL